MTDQADTPPDETEHATEAQHAALARFAKANAVALQSALQFAAQTEQSLATALIAMADAGLTVDDIAVQVGLRREYVEQLLDGGRMTLRFL